MDGWMEPYWIDILRDTIFYRGEHFYTIAPDLTPTTMTNNSNELSDILNYISSFILHYLSNSARIGHRSRLNIFDIVKVMNALNIIPFDLKNYIKWSNRREAAIFLEEIFSKSTLKTSSPKDCKLNLSFGIDVNETKRPGYEYFPPIPSSFTFKFTPVTN